MGRSLLTGDKFSIEAVLRVYIVRGAQSAVFASLLPAKTDIRGAFLWHDNTVLDWVNGPLPASV